MIPFMSENIANMNFFADRYTLNLFNTTALIWI